MTADIQEDWQVLVPRMLHADAAQFLAWLQGVPEMKPQQCPWCGCGHFKQYPSDATGYNCLECRRRFNAWSGTPFSNCRHQAQWVVYARARLCGQGMYRAGKQVGLSHGTCEYRESVIETQLAERRPALLEWWCGRVDRQTSKPVPLRTTPFTSREEAWAHHNHEYIRCLECGKLYSALDAHLRKVHRMSAMEYREKWQIMKQIPLSGFANRRSHSDAINEKIRNGEVDPLALAAAMQEACRLNGRKKPFNPDYIGKMHGDRLKAQKLWEQSPAIKTVDEPIRQMALSRMQQRHLTGEKVKDIARDIGVANGTLYEWLKRWPEPE